ncbi:MAG: arsenite methyltransferase [Anaerolineae bacterium]
MQDDKDQISTREQVRRQVQQRYGAVARDALVRRSPAACCAPGSASDCGCGCGASLDEQALLLGYSAADAAGVPEGANLGLGCGNPVAIASLQPGETVLDLGSGAGFDCFLAARQVGPGGHVIGVDMTPEMVARATQNAETAGYTWVEFRLGEIEHLPVDDGSIDLIMSNCVVNLSPDKPAVFAEAFRVLKRGGRIAIADTVATADLPEEARRDMALWAGCISGSATISELHEMLREAGFGDVRIEPKESSREIISQWAPGSRAEEYILSATIQAVKPGGPTVSPCC